MFFKVVEGWYWCNPLIDFDITFNLMRVVPTTFNSSTKWDENTFQEYIN